MSDNAELSAYFEALDYARLQQLVVDRQEEGVHTEFKQWSKNFKGQLAKAISGFANGDGGIVVWTSR